MKYRKKPVVIEAVQFTGKNKEEIVLFIDGGTQVYDEPHGRPGLLILAREGLEVAAPGDWIIKGVIGEFYPCEPDVFAATYEPA